MQQHEQQQIETNRFVDKQQRIRTETRSSTTTAHNNSNSSSSRMLDTMNISTLAPHIINQRSCFFYMTNYDNDYNGYLNYTEYQTFLQNILTTNNEYYNEISECNDYNHNRIMLLLLTNQSYYQELSCLCELFVNETKIVEEGAVTTRSSTTNDTTVSCCNRTDFDQNVLYLPDVHYITMDYNIVVCQHIAQTVHDTCNANQTIGPIPSNSNSSNNTNITEPTSDTNNTTSTAIVKSEHVLLRYMLPALIICIGLLLTFTHRRYNFNRQRKQKKKADKALAAAAASAAAGGELQSDDDSLSSSSSSSPTTCSSNKDSAGGGTDLDNTDEKGKSLPSPSSSLASLSNHHPGMDMRDNVTSTDNGHNNDDTSYIGNDQPVVVDECPESITNKNTTTTRKNQKKNHNNRQKVQQKNQQQQQQHMQQHDSPVTMCGMDIPMITTAASTDIEDAASVISSSSSSSDESMTISFSQ